MKSKDKKSGSLNREPRLDLLCRLKTIPEVWKCCVFVLLMCILTFFCGSCINERASTGSSSRRVLLDFEDETGFEELSWKCGTLYSRVREHAASGNFSLRVDMYPVAEWPGFGMAVKDGWAGYSRLSFHVFNPAKKTLVMSYRIDDRKGSPPYEDRVNGRIALRPGAQVITLDLENLKTSGTRRSLELDKIECFLLFLHRPNNKTSVFLDDFVLYH